MPSKKHKRYKLLLDEGLPPRQSYRQLNNLHDVKHIKHDYKLGGAADKKVLEKAKKELRILVTFNIRDFKLLIHEDTPSVIALSPKLTNKQADPKICKLLKRLKTGEIKGYLISISNSGITLKKQLSNQENNLL